MLCRSIYTQPLFLIRRNNQISLPAIDSMLQLFGYIRFMGRSVQLIPATTELTEMMIFKVSFEYVLVLIKNENLLSDFQFWQFGISISVTVITASFSVLSKIYNPAL